MEMEVEWRRISAGRVGYSAQSAFAELIRDIYVDYYRLCEQIGYQGVLYAKSTMNDDNRYINCLGIWVSTTRYNVFQLTGVYSVVASRYLRKPSEWWN